MPQFPVIGYALQVQSNPPPMPGTPPLPFRTGVGVQLQPNGPYTWLLVNGPDEFAALVALIQTPGRLLFDPAGMTLEKVEP